MIRGLFLSATLFVSSLYGESACPTLFNNEQAAQVAEQVMNTWFSSVKNKDTQAVSHLFAPRALILHSYHQNLRLKNYN